MKSINRSKVNLSIVFISCLFLLIGFQNCGQVKIDTPSTLMITNSKSGTGYLCIPDGFTLDTFFITNLNAKTSKAGIFPDTDGDGLDDFEEQKLGTNPNLRRTSGKISDAICSNVDYGINCANFNLSCSLTENSFGFNECDILALNLNQTVQNGIGIDSDKDGIPDYLELRINSFANMSDSYSDLDFDLYNAIAEAEQGTSIRNSNTGLDAKNLTKVAKTKITNSGCAGEYWKIEIQNLPTVGINAFLDSDNSTVNYSHNANENLIFTFLKIKPIGSLTDPAKTFTAIQKLNFDLNNVERSFVFSQSNLFFSGDVDQ